MGKQGNRVLDRIRRGAARASLALWACAVSLVLVCDSFSSSCDSTLLGEPTLLDTDVHVRGEETIKMSLPVRRASEVMVFAQEHGVDITLEVTDAAGRVLGRGDSPIRRAGVQRIELKVSDDQPYYVSLTSKEQGDANPSVRLRAVDLGRASNVSCVNVHKMLARADADYAAGQAVTRSASARTAIDSSKAYSDAARAYREAAERLRVAGPSRLLGETQLAEAADLYQDVEAWNEANSWAAKAAGTYDDIKDRYGSARAEAIEAVALTEIGVAARTDSEPSPTSRILGTARTMLQRAAAFHARRGELYDEAWALNNLGIAYYLEDRYEDAIGAYRRAAPIFAGLAARSREAQVLQNIALVEYELGRLSDAVPHYQRILDILDRNRTPKLYAIVLNNSALANWASGNEDVALRQYSQSLALARTIQDAYEQAVALHGLASVYNTLGDQNRALALYTQALALRSSTLDVRGRTASLRAIGNLLRQQGHPEQALAMHREALALASAPSMRDRIVVQMAKDLDELGRMSESAKELEAVLTRRIPGDEVEYARALQERATHRISAGDYSGAQLDLESSLSTFRTYESPTDEFTSWVSLATLLRRQNRTDEALAAVDHALALVEEVRHQSANPELRSTLLQPLRPAFDLKISMLAERYFAARDRSLMRELATLALETAEHARARALSDFQNIDVMAPGLDTKLLERRRAIYREIAARRFRLEASLDHSGTSDAQIQAIRSDIATLRQDIDEIDARIGAASETAHPGNRLGELAGLRPDRVPSSTAVIEYWLGAKEAFAWVLSQGGISMTRLGSSSRISSQSMALHQTLRSFGATSQAERLEAAERLYTSILKPLETQLSGSRTLIFAPDGALHYVPFATLRTIEQGRSVFLVEGHDIAVTPSIEMLLRPEEGHIPASAAGRMLLVADPVYAPDDSRVSHSASKSGAQPQSAILALVRGADGGTQLQRLPGATREAAAIAALLAPDSVDRLEGLGATKERFLGAPLDEYRFIHVASHATTDSEIPQASALILSTVDGAGNTIDGKVLAADFMSVRLHASTVVLSACDTALGKSIAGEGLVGLRYVVLARGARSVISSLWPASDQVTADLMVSFYSGLLRRHSSVIAAWSDATREALAARYADPGTWGAFMLTLSHIRDAGP